MSTQQGSSSFTLAIGIIAAVITGAFMLTFTLFPLANAFMGSALWSSETSTAADLLGWLSGIWEFWGGIIAIAILMFVWIRTRQ